MGYWAYDAYCSCLSISSQTYAGVVPAPRKKPTAAQPAARRTRSNGQATVQKLLKFGREELDQVGTLGFNVDRVLQRAKVSASSLHHHFGNRDGFIVALEFERSYADMIREIELLRNYVASTSDTDALLKASEVVLSLGGDTRGKERRRHRIETLAAASHNPALQQMLADSQRDGTAMYIDVLRIAVKGRAGKYRYPIEGIAYLAQSILIGRILVDLMDDEALGKAWENTALGALREIFATE